MRKTAAVCVAKLYDINAELVEDRGFLDMLKAGWGTAAGWGLLLVQHTRFFGVQMCLRVGASALAQAAPQLLNLLCLQKAVRPACLCASEHTCRQRLQDLIGDANPMVVANAVAALSEIQELGGKPVLELTLGTVSKLLRALNECTEWGQVRCAVMEWVGTRFATWPPPKGFAASLQSAACHTLAPPLLAWSPPGVHPRLCG